MNPLLHRTVLPAAALLALLGCGGGGGGGSPAPAPLNRAPQLALANSDQTALQFHAFDYDVTQGGRTFVDPDGDPLRYTVQLGPLQSGLQASGDRITGSPQILDTTRVTVTASDSHGASATHQFRIFVEPNHPPTVNVNRDDLRVQVGENLWLDATLGGARMADPEGDPVTYLVRLRGAPGITLDGTRVGGALSAVGAVEVTVEGTDPYGARSAAVFVIAAPAAPPGAPTLPATPYTYKDESLPLPDDYRLSSEFRAPLADMQPVGNRTSDAGAALGRVLFHDQRLSITHTVACASCHQRAHGFASPERFNTGAIGVPLTRNAMALANARYNVHGAWFSDTRAASIQEVARQALTQPVEMGNTLPAITAQLQATSFYPPLFEAAFGTPGVDADRILRALEQYVQALISYRSKFDQACDTVGGVPKDCAAGLTAEEARGRDIFMGSSMPFGCIDCHALPSGANTWLANNGLDARFTDPGLGNGRFRPASLYNIALTAPYMHDGRFATLREVIDHYDHGLEDSVDLDTRLRDGQGHAARLNLAEQDKAALEAFLGTLTDTGMLADPKFSDPF
jgi:cytochrome c peroxidase